MAAVDKTVKSKQWQNLLAKNGWSDLYMPGDGFAQFLNQEISQTEKIIDTLGLAKK